MTKHNTGRLKGNAAGAGAGAESNRRVQAALYARVSSADQEKEGFSIPAQQRLLREYAQLNNITIAEEFVDVETAKATGRAGFSKLLAYLKQHRNRVRVILVEKTDRLYRNLDRLEDHLIAVARGWTTPDKSHSMIHGWTHDQANAGAPNQRLIARLLWY